MRPPLLACLVTVLATAAAFAGCVRDDAGPADPATEDTAGADSGATGPFPAAGHEDEDGTSRPLFPDLPVGRAPPRPTAPDGQGVGPGPAPAGDSGAAPGAPAPSPAPAPAPAPAPGGGAAGGGDPSPPSPPESPPEPDEGEPGGTDAVGGTVEPVIGALEETVSGTQQTVQTTTEETVAPLCTTTTILGKTVTTCS